MPQNNSPKIVLVDDDPFCLSVYEQEIKNLGFKNVQTYSSGTELLNQLEEAPDIIFLDYNLGDFKGLELLQRIKKYDPNIYVVFVSGQPDMKVTVELFKNGAFDYIVKDEFETFKITVVLAKWLSACEFKSNIDAVTKADQNEDCIKLIMQAQETTRRELADELHDNVSQLLGASKLYIDTAVNNENGRLAMLIESRSILNSAIDELRKLSHGLRSISVLNQNLETELDKILVDLKRQNRYNIQAEIPTDLLNKKVPATVQHHLIRIIQEITNNMVKYASAKNVEISITIDKQNLLLKFFDDGIGFDLQKIKRGIGLDNIVKRVTGVNGKYTINTSPGKGCCWKIRIPVKNATSLV